MNSYEQAYEIENRLTDRQRSTEHVELRERELAFIASHAKRAAEFEPIVWRGPGLAVGSRAVVEPLWPTRTGIVLNKAGAGSQ